MRRTTSLVRRVDAIEQQRYHARLQAWTPSFNDPTCHRCAKEVWDDDSLSLKWMGPRLVRVELVNINGKSVELVGYCDQDDHFGPREDAIRVDFDWTPDDEDVDRALRSCVFFPRGAEQEGAR